MGDKGHPMGATGRPANVQGWGRLRDLQVGELVPQGGGNSRILKGGLQERGPAAVCGGGERRGIQGLVPLGAGVRRRAPGLSPGPWPLKPGYRPCSSST